MKHRIFGFLISMLFVTSANAAWFTAEIDRMQLNPTGNLSVFFHSGVTQPCGSNRIDFDAPVDSAGFKYLYAALLAYEAQKEAIQFLIVSCAGTIGLFHNIESAPG